MRKLLGKTTKPDFDAEADAIVCWLRALHSTQSTLAFVRRERRGRIVVKKKKGTAKK